MKGERMLALTRELIEARGPAGREDEVRAIVLRELAGSCDQTWVDEAGNAIGLIRGASAGKTRKPRAPSMRQALPTIRGSTTRRLATRRPAAVQPPKARMRAAATTATTATRTTPSGTMS